MINFGVLSWRVLSLLGAQSYALRQLEDKSLEHFKLRQLKKVAAQADKLGISREHVVREVQRLYPESQFGTLEEARLAISQGHQENGRVLLEKILKSNKNSEYKKQAKVLLAALPKETVDNKKASVAKKVTPTNVAPPVKNASPELEEEPSELPARFDPSDLKGRLRLLTSSSPWQETKKLAQGYLKQGLVLETMLLLLSMPRKMSLPLEYHLMLSDALVRAGDPARAYDFLNAAQAIFPGDRRLYSRLGDIARKDRRAVLAHNYYSLMCVKSPVFGRVKCMSFEVDAGFESALENSLQAIEQFSDEDLLRYNRQIARAGARFPGLYSRFRDLRLRAQKSLKVAVKGKKEIENKIGFAIKGRWLDEAAQLRERAKLDQDHVHAVRMATLHERLAEFSRFLPVADCNEEGKEPVGVWRGMPVNASAIAGTKIKLVEFFIPSVFFSETDEEKPTYEVVRRFFRILLTKFLERDDVCIVFRHQFNWRYVIPITKGSVVSYHTSSASDDRFWHVQESTLAGRCSVDHRGFAGFSSLANDHSQLCFLEGNISDEEMKINIKEMEKEYILSNTSKYAQCQDIFSSKRPYIFVALQVITDVVADLAHITGMELLGALIRRFEGQDIDIVVKRHPFCESMTVKETLRRYADEGRIVLSDASVHSLISKSLGVYTVNSGVGLEALMHLKPVWICGSADYSYAVAGEFKNVKDVMRHRFIEDENTRIEREARIKLFLWFYNRRYARKVDDATVAALVEEIVSSAPTGDRLGSISNGRY